MQVIPDGVVAAIRRVRAFEKLKGTTSAGGVDPDWKPVVIGNPSGKMRRMNLLEMGRWSRWSEIRRLNLLEEDEKRTED